jgi:putative nucleotidyltransferase with HDIG domain
MEETGILKLILPELSACRGIEQKGMHRFDVLDHLLFACDAADVQPLDVRLAALFHDIGKPQTRSIDQEGVYTFYNHETVSANIAENIMTRFRFPLKTTKTVSLLVRNHMFHYESEWTDSAVRRFILRSGIENLDMLFALRRADACGIAGEKSAVPALLDEFHDRIGAILEKEHVFSLKDLDINGNDLILAGIPAGPKIGMILMELLDTVLDDPSLNNNEKLLEISRALYSRRYSE